MSVTIRDVLLVFGNKYGLKLLAGEAGIQQPISWMYTAEDYKTVDYIRGGEFVVTTGMILVTETEELEDWLKKLIDKLVCMRAAGLIVNIGDYISEVPLSVIQYCDTIGMPLITMPWKVHLVDIYRDICGFLFDSEQNEKSMERALSASIFSQKLLPQYEEALKRGGYGKESKIIVACLSHSATTKDKYLLNSIIYSVLNEIGKYTVIHEMEEMILVFTDVSIEAMEEAAVLLAEKLNRSYQYDPIFVGISAPVKGVYALNRAYLEARFALQAAIKENRKICSFQKLGFQKLIYAIQDKSILNEYFKDTIEPLYLYDLQHQTKYMDILQLYLNGVSKDMIAQITFQHRNTISNQLRKIWSIIGTEPCSPEERFQYQVAFYILPYVTKEVSS